MVTQVHAAAEEQERQWCPFWGLSWHGSRVSLGGLGGIEKEQAETNENNWGELTPNIEILRVAIVRSLH